SSATGTFPRRLRSAISAWRTAHLAECDMHAQSPMPRRVLITGGAGFLGAHLADELLEHGYHVRALDLLLPQVHGAARRRPAHLASEVELVQADIRDAPAIRRALDGIDAVCHLSARVGVAQSMYELAEYTAVNNFGTATLLEAIVEHSIQRPIERLVLASS